MLKFVFVSSHPRPRHFRKDGSFIYRCENLGLGLEALGHQVVHRHLNSLVAGEINADVAVFMRPADSLRFRWVIRRLRRRGCRLVADFDDLIFSPEFAASRPSVVLGETTASAIAAKFRRSETALASFDRFTFSTMELASRFRELHPGRGAIVIPNAVHRSWRGLAPSIVTPHRLTYFSGTRTHDRDFALALPALRRLLEERDDFVLQVVGPLQTSLTHPRVLRLDKVPFPRFADLVRSSYVNLAPLEDTPFNRCKSALKAVEAGCFGVPTVASPIGDYLRVSTEGVLYAGSDEEWYRQLDFVLDESNRARLSAGLAERMRPMSDVDEFARAFVQFVA